MKKNLKLRSLSFSENDTFEGLDENELVGIQGGWSAIIAAANHGGSKEVENLYRIRSKQSRDLFHRIFG